jgi:hypothetical protein
MELETAAAERGRRKDAWLGGLMFRGLCLPAGLTVDQEHREREGARAAAEDLAGELGGGDGNDSGLEAQVLAAQFVSAHAAAMDRQAEANRRDLPDHARATSQRLARQLMALTTSQVHALCRLKAERRREREAAAKLAEREAAQRFKARAAETRAMITGFEQTLKDLARSERTGPEAARDGGFEAELDGDFAGDFGGDFGGDFEGGFAEGLGEGSCGAVPDTAPSEPSAASPAQPAKPEAVGAGVPKPPDVPAPPLNRRALKRLRRKERGEGMR